MNPVDLDLPSDPVHDCWSRQARTEYIAASLMSELLHWLIQLGVRPDLLVRGTKVVADEVRHAAMCHDLYLAFGGEPRPVAVPPSLLQRGHDLGVPLIWRALTAAGDLACEESIATAVFRTRARNATHQVASPVVAAILKDEATHAGFAWDLLEELDHLVGHEPARAWVRPRIPAWLRLYLFAGVEANPPIFRQEEIATGLIQRPEHLRVMHDSIARRVLPRFKKLGLLEREADLSSLRAEALALGSAVLPG